MKKNVEIDRIYFNGYCESAKKQALILAAIFAESLNLYELETQSRLRRVNSEIDHIFEERKVLNRPLYILYAFDLGALFELFERMNYLQNPEEMAKLQQAINSVEKFHRLGLLLMETFSMEEVENFQARQLAKKAMDYRSSNKKSDKETSLLLKEDDLPRSEKQPSLIDSKISKRKTVTEIVSFGCKVTASYLKADVIIMNNKYHILAPGSSVDELVIALMTDDWTKINFKIYLKCKTIVFKAFIKYLQRNFNSLRLVNIGRSGLFISSLGNPINESNIGSAKCSNWEKKHFAEYISR